MPGPLLRFDRVGKSFHGIRALHDVSLGLERGRVLGLVGENGAGKSTLMNILGGVVQPDAGSMTLGDLPYSPRGAADASAAGVAFIHQELNLFTNLSVADNLFIDRYPQRGNLPFIDWRRASAEARGLLAAVDLHVAPNTPVDRLQPGERQLVEIARALGTGARVFIFDEPTTSLTNRETERLFQIIGRLRGEGKAIVYISHILADVVRLADAIAVLRDGVLVAAGPRTEFTVDRLITLMVGGRLDQLYPPRRSSPAEPVALAVEGVSQPGVVKDIRFTLHRGEILGLFGLMGSGRSGLARILFGQDPFRAGRIVVGEAVRTRFSPSSSIEQGLAFVPEDRRGEGLLMDATVLDNVGLAALRRYARPGVVARVDQAGLGRAVDRIVERLKIRCGPPARTVAKNLSGGNQQKVVIGRGLLVDPGVLILDEPTRGIDVGAKHEVYSIMNDLAARGTGILCISSELEELMGMCDRIIVMGGGEIQGTFDRSSFSEEEILRTAFREHERSDERDP